MTRQYWANLALCIVLGALAIFSVTHVGSALTPQGLFMSKSTPSPEAEKLLKDVVMTKYKIGESPDKMVEADFYIQNNSSQSVKNIIVECDFVGENGKHSDRETWNLSETIPAKHQAKISSVTKRFVNTRSEAMSCSIVDIQAVKKPAFALERHVAKGHGTGSKDEHGAEPAAAGH